MKGGELMYINNYSGLFSGFGNQSSSFGTSGLYGLLGEYNNIRTGTYFKALKGYYNQVSSSSSDRLSVDSSKIEELWKESATDKTQSSGSASDSDISSAYTQVKSNAEDLKEATKALTKTGDDSLFVEKEKTIKDKTTGEESTVKELDKKAIYSAVRNFVSTYNNTIAAATESENEAIIRNAGYMSNQTNVYSKPLEEIGITVKDDKTLSIDSDKLESANIDDIKALFNGNTSYANFVSRSAELVGSAAKNEATSSYFYNNAGNYQNYGTMASAMNWYL